VEPGDDYDRAHMRLCAARKVWPIRHQLTPSGKHTWAVWFQRMFGITLDELRQKEGSAARQHPTRAV